MNGHYELMLFFIRRGLGQHDLQISEETVTTASGNGSASVVRLLAPGFKSSRTYSSVLNRALSLVPRNGHKEIAKFLILDGADVNATVADVLDIRGEGYTYLPNGMFESKGRSNALQAALLGFGWSEKLASGLMFVDGWLKAGTNKDEETIQILLRKGSDVNALAVCPTHPLHKAVMHCPVTVIQSIVDRGAGIHASTAEHGTVPQVSAVGELGPAKLTKKLLEVGAVLPANKMGAYMQPFSPPVMGVQDIVIIIQMFALEDRSPSGTCWIMVLKQC